MSKFVEIECDRYPQNLIDRDWSRRCIQYKAERVELLKEVHVLEVFDDDVWLVTLPKCGTTWMQELLWLVLNNYDFETAKREDLEVRSPFLEFDYYINENLATAFTPIENLSRPRLIKSHLCLPLLPAQLWDKKPKVIYVGRNLKDACVSLFYHIRSVGYTTDQTLDQFVDSYMQDTASTQPFLHLTEFYSLKNEPWLFYTSFERMKLDLRQTISDVCKFLNKTISEENMQKMLKHLSFEEMKNNTKTNHHWEFKQLRNKVGLPYEHHNFVRKGLVNGYREELSPEMAEKMDKWVSHNLSEHNVTMEELLLLN